MKYLTKSGIEQLNYQRELIKRKLVELTEQAHEISCSGYLYESVEFGNILQEKEHLENELSRLENVLEKARVISNSNKYRIADLGCLIRVSNNNMCYVFQLVDSLETDPGKGKVSVCSPLGKAIIGKRSGDRVYVNTENGAIEFDIQEVI